MNRKLDNKLCNIAPHLFGDRHADMRNTALCWGFECGNGWYDLLAKAAMELEALILKYIEDHPEWENPFPWFFMDSWYGIKWSFCHPLIMVRRLCEWMRVALGLQAAEPWWPRASQIKEKYGTLRFYLSSGTDEMYAITDKAESQSSKTCEQCGRPGKIRGHYWYYTACGLHTKKEDK